MNKWIIIVAMAVVATIATCSFGWAAQFETFHFELSTQPQEQVSNFLDSKAYDDLEGKLVIRGILNENAPVTIGGQLIGGTPIKRLDPTDLSLSDSTYEASVFGRLTLPWDIKFQPTFAYGDIDGRGEQSIMIFKFGKGALY